MRYEFLVRRGSISLGRRFAPRIDDLLKYGKVGNVSSDQDQVINFRRSGKEGVHHVDRTAKEFSAANDPSAEWAAVPMGCNGDGRQQISYR
jgi:hypothetical protein